MANPDPEVDPEVAAKYASVVATGRSDYPNQINNVLAFPGVFRGAFQARARRISEGMKLAAADALAAVVGDDLARRLRHPERLRRAGGPCGRRCRRPGGRRRRGARLTPKRFNDHGLDEITGPTMILKR